MLAREPATEVIADFTKPKATAALAAVEITLVTPKLSELVTVCRLTPTLLNAAEVSSCNTLSVAEPNNATSLNVWPSTTSR